MRFLGSFALLVFAALAAAEEPLRRLGDQRFRVSGLIANSALSADGKRLAVLSTSGPRNQAIVTVFDVATRRPIIVSRVPVSEGQFARPGLAFSPDGKRIAAAVNPTSIFALDAATGREVWREPVAKDKSSAFCAFDPAGRLIRVFNSLTRLVDLDAGAVVAIWPVGGVAAISPDGKAFVRTKKIYSEIELGDPSSGQVRFVLPLRTASNGSENGYAFSHDGWTLAVVDSISRVVLVEVATGRTIHTWNLPKDYITGTNSEYAVAFDMADRHVMVWAGAQFCRLELATRRESPIVRDASKISWKNVHVSPDGQELFVLKFGGIEIRNLATGEPSGDQASLGGSAFALSPDGSRLIVGDQSGRITAWNRKSDRFESTVATSKLRGPIDSLVVSPDGRWLAYGSTYGEFEVVPLGEAIPPGPRSISGVRPDQPILTWTPDSRLVIGYRSEVLANQRHLVAFDAGQGKVVRSFSQFNPLVVTPDGRELICIRYDLKQPRNIYVTTLIRVRIADGFEVGDFELDTAGRTVAASRAAFSPDGSRIAFGAHDQLQIDGGEPFIVVEPEAIKVEGRRFNEHRFQGSLHTFAFTPNGHWIVTGGSDCAVKVWESATGKLVRRYDGHDLAVTQVAVAADGRSVVSGSSDGILMEWSLEPKAENLPTDSEKLWDAAVGIPSNAVPAAWRLIADEKHRAFVVAKLRPAPKPDAAKVAKWLADLDAPAFADRKAATKALEDLSRSVEAELRETLAKTDSAEVRQRVEGLLKRFEKKYSPEELRAVRLVQASEWHRRKEILTEWSTGAPSAILTREATAALARMK